MQELKQGVAPVPDIVSAVPVVGGVPGSSLQYQNNKMVGFYSVSHSYTLI